MFEQTNKPKSKPTFAELNGFVLRSVGPALLHEATSLAPHLPAAEQCAVLQPFRQSTCELTL